VLQATYLVAKILCVFYETYNYNTWVISHTQINHRLTIVCGFLFISEERVMICDNCKQGKMSVVGQLANVKSSVLNIVKCWTCGYGSVRKLNTKRRL
jgi:hypothetical protein